MIHERIDIWEGLEYNGQNPEFRPGLEVYVLENKPKRGAILVCPGGGYAYTSPREAQCIALSYNAAGYHAFVLDYSVAPNKHPQPLYDVTRAMCIIRDNAEKWGIDENKIFVIGFSAGGHLTASLGVHWDKDFLMNVPGMEKGKNKPNGLILCYPVISSGDKAHRGSFNNLLGEDASPELLEFMSLEKQVSDKTPPTFIFHNVDDAGVPVENTMLFASALREHNIEFEMHLYPRGGHGVSIATLEVCGEDCREIREHIQSWLKLSIEWLGIVFGGPYSE